MAKEAERNGAAFFGGVKVTGFKITGGRVKAVHTTEGDIEADLVVSAVGIWAPALDAKAGVPIPLSPMQHIYAVTTPLPDLAGATEEISIPFMRHQDSSMYFRQVGDALGIGSYRHEPLLVESEDILSHEEAPIAPAEMEFTPEHFEPAMNAARELLPGVRGAGLTRKFNGMFSFTTDGFPVLGESPQVRGFWSAQAVWITHAAGVGKAVAEWIVNGEPTVDLRECDILRFHPHALSRPYVRARSAQQYREVYDIIHPQQQMASPRNIRLTPFFARQQEQGAVFFENAGWERPQWHDANQHLLEELDVKGASRTGWEAREWSPTVAAEHAATRERVAMFDLTPFAQFEVTGPGALDALQRLATNQMDKPVGAITYTSMLTPSGGIKCDLTVTRLGEERFLVVTGGAMGLHDLDWIQSHLPDDRSVSVADVSSGRCCIGLWGPRARDVLSRVTEDDVSNEGFPYMTAKPITIGEVPVTALRISYVGELGWEVYAPVEQGLRLWDTLVGGWPAARRHRRGWGRVRLAAARERLPAVGQRHPHRVQPVRGGHRVRREDEEGRFHRQRRAQAGAGAGHGAQTVLHDVRRPGHGGHGQGAHPRRRPSAGLRDQRQLRPLHRPRHRVRLPARRVRQAGNERRSALLRRAAPGHRGERAAVRSRRQSDESVSRNGRWRDGGE